MSRFVAGGAVLVDASASGSCGRRVLLAVAAFLIGLLGLSAAASPVWAIQAPASITAAPGAERESVKVNWQPPAALSPALVLSYELRWRKTSAPASIGNRALDRALRTTTITALTKGVAYSFSIRAWTPLGPTDWTREATATPVGPPNPPVNVTAGIGATGEAIDVRWTPAAAEAVAPVDRYVVSYTAAGSPASTVLDASIPASATSYTATLPQGPQYTLTVRAAGPTGQSDPRSAAPVLLPKTTLPVLRVNTDGAAPIASKDDYVKGQVTVTPAAAGPVTDAYSGVTEIKGHGNSTWNRPKKPYRLKLDKAAPLFGLPSSKHWVLLANYIDRSQIRNAAAFRLGAQTSLAWTPRTRYVELVVNGRYVGLYQLAEQVRLDKNRINIDALKPTDTAGDALTGGYHIELESRWDPAVDPGFKTILGNSFELKDPEEPTAEQAHYIRDYVDTFESWLTSPSFADPVIGYANFIDVPSFIDWYLVEEALKNNDAWYSSANFYKPRLGKLAAGPLWDFDQSAGAPLPTRSQTPVNWGLRANSPWFKRLFQDPAFLAKVKARWVQLRPAITALGPYIDEQAAHIRTAALLDQQVWGLSNQFAQEVANVKAFIASRARWIDAQYGVGTP